MGVFLTCDTEFINQSKRLLPDLPKSLVNIDLSGCGNSKGENLMLIDKTIDGDVESYEDRENMEKTWEASVTILATKESYQSQFHWNNTKSDGLKKNISSAFHHFLLFLFLGKILDEI